MRYAEYILTLFILFLCVNICIADIQNFDIPTTFTKNIKAKRNVAIEQKKAILEYPLFSGIFGLLIGSLFSLKIANRQIKSNNTINQKQIESNREINEKQIKATFELAKENIISEVRANSRMKWIGEFRDIISRFLSLHEDYMKEKKEESKKEIESKIEYLTNKICLSINPEEDAHKTLIQNLRSFSDTIITLS